MPLKSQMIDELGERALLVPERVNGALAANDRVKYLLTLLQSAAAHADDPSAPFSDLRAEREASRVGDSRLDEVVAASRRAPGDGYWIPHATRVHAMILEGIGEMIAPLGGSEARDYEARLRALVAAAPPLDRDVVPAAYLDEIASVGDGDRDRVHRLVHDVHRALCRVQASLSAESIDGASAYGLADADRPLVRAFMAGLASTAALKFDHPGLGTTATRSGDRLVIQNDIGTTDAHVLVLHVTGLVATVTYTDVHVERAEFFQRMLRPFAVAWEEVRSRRARDGGGYQLFTGRFAARDARELERYLSFLGSRIVFLIDWNRARKRLQSFVRKRDAIELLQWAADNNYGHRAFLQLGGERLVGEALERAGGAPVRYGERLDDVLGRDAVVEYLRFVLRTTSTGLLEGRSERLLRDEVRTELRSHFHSAEEIVLGLVADHVALGVELAGGVRDGLAQAATGDGDEVLERVARRARERERAADELVVRVRETVHRAGDLDVYGRLIGEIDDVADSLEEASFLLTLAPRNGSGSASLYEPLQSLAGLVAEGARGLVTAVESATCVARGGTREDVQDFLEAVDRIVTVEHRTDEAERRVTAVLVGEAPDFRHLHVLSELAGLLEEAADSLLRSALILRDQVLGEELGR